MLLLLHLHQRPQRQPLLQLAHLCRTLQLMMFAAAVVAAKAAAAGRGQTGHPLHLALLLLLIL
jgi:hypothetical protein